MSLTAQHAEIVGLPTTAPWHDKSRAFAAEGCECIAAQLCEFASEYDGLSRGQDPRLVEWLYREGERLMRKARDLRTQKARA